MAAARLPPRPLPAALAVAGLILAGRCAPGPVPPTDPGEVFAADDGTRFRVETVATGLQIPWDLAFAPDGRLFVTERPGRVRILQNGQLRPEAALVLDDVEHIGEGGLLGLALHPGFAVNRLVYLLYTARRADGVLVNRIVRFREVDGRLGEMAVILDNIGAASIHNGGRIRFGPDGHLYATMGDAASPPLSQDLGSLNGSILRIDEDGRTPGDNPFASPIYAYGLRNPQGLDWHPQSGELWATDHGATGNDEVNRIEAGRNYGWPVIEGQQTQPGMEAPVLLFTPAVAPSGASFYRGQAIAGFRNDLFFATLRGQHLHRVRFEPGDPRRVQAHERLLEGRFGRLRQVITGPDGALYFCTNNRDGRGEPAPDDDRIVRILPPQ